MPVFYCKVSGCEFSTSCIFCFSEHVGNDKTHVIWTRDMQLPKIDYKCDEMDNSNLFVCTDCNYRTNCGGCYADHMIYGVGIPNDNLILHRKWATIGFFDCDHNCISDVPQKKRRHE